MKSTSYNGVWPGPLSAELREIGRIKPLCEMSDGDLRAWSVAFMSARLGFAEIFAEDDSEGRRQAAEIEAEILRRGLIVVYPCPSQ